MLGRLRRNRNNDEDLIDVAERLAPYVDECMDQRIVFPDVGPPTMEFVARASAEHAMLLPMLGLEQLAVDASS